jgi:NAD+ synthase
MVTQTVMTQLTDDECRSAISNMRAFLKLYLQRSKLKCLVLGMSGGFDSTFTAAVARPVCDELGIPLYGRSLPITSNEPEEIDRAKQAGEIFCHHFKEVDLSEDYLRDLKRIEAEEGLVSKIGRGNLKARKRMSYLYNLAGMHRGMVLSTDNLSEYLLGFWTLHGDVGDYGMFQNVWKTELYQMAGIMIADWYTDALTAIDPYTLKAKANTLKYTVWAVPTDGLGISNSDMDQIGAQDYAEVDKVLSAYIYMDRKEAGKQGIDWDRLEGVIQMNRRTTYKRENPRNLSRGEVFKGWREE